MSTIKSEGSGEQGSILANFSPEKIEILYSDELLLAVHKPAGIHVHPTELSKGETSLQDLLESRFGRRPQPLHRLDRPTAGITVFSWDLATTAQLSQSFRTREVEKTYQALVRGWCPGFSTWKPLEDLDSPGTLQEAQTLVWPRVWYEIPEPLGRYVSVRFSLVDLHPHTGRRHQLRRHLKSHSHPLIGDTRYSDGRYNDYFRKRWGEHRLFLLAQKLTFPHPLTGQSVRLETRWEPETRDFLERLQDYQVRDMIPSMPLLL